MGGAERVAVYLANSWSELGYEVTLMPTFSGGGSGSFYNVSDMVDLVYLNELIDQKSNYFKRVFALRSFLVRGEFDFVVSFLTNVNIIALISSFFLKKPVLICERSDPYVDKLPFFFRLLRFFLYPFSSKVLIQTNELFKKIESDRFCFYKRKLGVVGNPISSKIEKNSFYECCSSEKKIISMGRLDKDKQIDHIIEAFHKVDRKGWILEIYGDGPQKGYLQSLIDKYYLNDCVFLNGAVIDVDSVYKGARIFCMASLYEGFPNSLLEAMSLGCAVISYKTPSGPSEMLDYGLSGVLVEMNDIDGLSNALQNFIDNPNEIENYSRKSYLSVINKYSSSAVLFKWDAIFDELNIKKKI